MDGSRQSSSRCSKIASQRFSGKSIHFREEEKVEIQKLKLFLKIYNTLQISQISHLFQEGNNYLIRIFAKNEVGFSDPLENDEPFKVERPAGYTGEEEKEDAKHDETPSLR